MGFGSFLKKAINPLTPFKAIGGAAKNLAQGNVAGALTGAATMGMAGGGGRLRDVRPMDPAAKDRMRAALTAGRNDGSIKGPIGMLKFASSYRDTPPPVASPAAPAPPGMEAMAQEGPGFGPKVMGAAAGMPSPWGGGAPAGPSPLQAGIQQMIGPQGEDPYEAWKAGGRQGDRPAGY